jgi:hypothetical protein
MVFGVIEGWMEGEMREQIAARPAAGDEDAAIAWTESLYLVMGQQGSHDEALEMGEKMLEFRRRILPEVHPDMYEFHVLTCKILHWIIAMLDMGFAGSAMNNLAILVLLSSLRLSPTRHPHQRLTPATSLRGVSRAAAAAKEFVKRNPVVIALPAVARVDGSAALLSCRVALEEEGKGRRGVRACTEKNRF